jgi:hypothetical protein
MNRQSGNEPNLTAYTGNPTLTGTLTEFDRWYPEQATDNLVYNKQGTLILGTNDAVTFRLVTDHTAGLGWVRLSFLMAVNGHHT